MLTHENFTSKDWANELNEYQSTKKMLPWGVTAKPEPVTYKAIKARDSIFNPILQKYNNGKEENNTKSQEDMRKSQHLAKSLVYIIFKTYKITNNYLISLIGSEFTL